MSTPARPRTTPSQRRWWVVGTVLVGLATALVVWYGIALNTNKPNWFYAGHEKITDSSVTVIYDVHREPDRPVVCRLVAQNENHEVVGTRDVTVPPRGAGSTRERSVVQTTSRPLVGNVTGCWYPEG